MTAPGYAAEEASTPPTSPVSAALLRFVAVYFATYTLGLVPRPLASEVATRVLGAPATLALTPTGSGDRAIDWAGALCALGFAALVAAVWTGLQPRPRSDRWLREWSQFGAAAMLGSIMVSYGMMKVFPVQMPAPTLVRLLEPLGQFSPMGVLWTFMGVSPWYQTFTGVVELVSGMLVFWSRTTVPGALLCLMAAGQIFALNLAYDVPVKLFSLHLILLALFLLAPHASRLVTAVMHDASVVPPDTSAAGLRTRRRWFVGRSALALLVLLAATSTAYLSWTRVGPNAERSPVYGIWDVVELRVNGTVRPPLVTNVGRWRRLVFERPALATFQRMDDTLETRRVKFDTTARRIDLLGSEGGIVGELRYDDAEPGVMTVSGRVDGWETDMRLERVDHTQFTLLQRGFRWVQDRPFNR